jgi:hypothetical protein
MDNLPESIVTFFEDSGIPNEIALNNLNLYLQSSNFMTTEADLNLFASMDPFVIKSMMEVLDFFKLGKEIVHTLRLSSILGKPFEFLGASNIH